MITTTTGTTAAAVAKEEAGTAILKDIQRQLKEAGRTAEEGRAEAIQIMMITVRIMILIAATVVMEAGSEILKDIQKLPREAGRTAGADHTGEARAEGMITKTTAEATREADHVADLLQWTAMR
jgi:hypothetical protein